MTEDVRSLRSALQRIANLPPRRQGDKPEPFLRAKRIALAALGAPPQVIMKFADRPTCDPRNPFTAIGADLDKLAAEYGLNRNRLIGWDEKNRPLRKLMPDSVLRAILLRAKTRANPNWENQMASMPGGLR